MADKRIHTPDCALQGSGLDKFCNCPVTVLSLLSGYLPADEAATVTDDLEAQVTADGYGTARTSAGFVSAVRYVNGQLSVKLTTGPGQ